MKRLTIATMQGFVATITAMILGSAPAYGANFSFTGSFTGDADTQSFFFTADGVSTATFTAYNYGGGTNAAGTVIPYGGFDPMLFLFDATDTLIRADDDGPNPVGRDPISGGSFDTNFSQVLPAGNYRIVMAQFHNLPVGLIADQFEDLPTIFPTGLVNFANGFQETDANFTNNLYHVNDVTKQGCSNRQFCDDLGFNRTPAWAFDILNVNQATIAIAVPEPDERGTALAVFAVLGLRCKLATDRKAKGKNKR
jgi:hypothetical protein